MHFTIDEKGNIGNCNCTPEQVEFCLKALNDHGITIDDIKEQYKKKAGLQKTATSLTSYPGFQEVIISGQVL